MKDWLWKIRKKKRHPKRKHVRAFIWSDMHFGSPLAKVKTFRTVLAQYEMDYLIGNGDIFETPDLRADRWRPFASRTEHEKPKTSRVPRSHLDAIEDINQRAKHGTKVIWVPGNHDARLWEVIACFIGADVVPEKRYVWEHKGKKFLFTHGDTCDVWYGKHPWLSEIATRIYEWIQYGVPQPYADVICSSLKSRSKSYVDALREVADGAAKEAHKIGAAHAFCGHTHHAEHREIEVDGQTIHYYNSGSWTASERPERDDFCSFITIDDEYIRIHRVDDKGNEVRVEKYPI